MPRRRVWLIDGHNMIFAVHGLQTLQVAARGEEARRALEERLQSFAWRRQERVVVVFDGSEQAAGRSVVRAPHFEVVFARGGDGAADNFIIREARRCAEEGRPVVVVTDDVRTLASRLPRGVTLHGVREFWLAHVEPRPSADDKQVTGDFADLERAMLAQAAAEELANGVPTLVSPARPTGPVPPTAGRPPSSRDAAGDLLRRKRERGRLRQERLLRRRGGGAGRR